MCLRADATTSAIHVRLILPGECHGDYPPRLCHTPFTRIWPHEELCRFSALVDNPWKWCASCWRKIALVLKKSPSWCLRGRQQQGYKQTRVSDAAGNRHSRRLAAYDGAT